MNIGEYMAMMDCQSSDEVYEKVSSWSSELSTHDHLVRSTILDIQASLEGLLKNVYFHILLTVLFQGKDKKKNESARDELFKTITRMNFSSIYRTLRPILQTYPDSDLYPIQAINDLRNDVAHSNEFSSIQYKGRNPFKDADSLAQVYLEAWAARESLKEFYHHMVKDPAAISAHYPEFGRTKFDNSKFENNE